MKNSPRRFLVFALLAFSLLSTRQASNLLLFAQDSVSDSEQAKPNVLFIAVDDMRVELGCYGDTLAKSPHIDALAKRGTLFKRAYCQQAVCNPSRASLLTGLRPSSLAIWDLPTHFRQRQQDVVTLPQHFKNNGYFTQNIGKIFHNWRQDDYRGDAQSWSVPSVLHYGRHGDDKALFDGDLPADQLNVPRCEERDVPDEAYFDGRIANLAVKALGDMKSRNDGGEPFFLAVGFWKPHAPFNAPKKYWDRYRRSDVTPAAYSQPPKNVPEIALHNSQEILRGFKDRPNGRPTREEAISLRHGYYAAINFVDEQIGKVLSALDQHDLTKNTIVVFWSDHGFHLGEHSLWAKTSNFELDARVPLIIATPDHAKGQRSDSLVELLDLYPTLAELCDLPKPKHVEGLSLQPILHEPTATVKDATHTWHPRPAYPAKGKNPKVMGYSMRTKRYRYAEWRDFEKGDVVATELYDHQVDPQEMNNLAVDPKYTSILQQQAKVLAKTHPQTTAYTSKQAK